MSDYPDLFSVAILSHPSRRCGHGPNSECKHLPTDLAVMRGAQAHELVAALDAEEAPQSAETAPQAPGELSAGTSKPRRKPTAQRGTQTRAKSASK